MFFIMSNYSHIFKILDDATEKAEIEFDSIFGIKQRGSQRDKHTRNTVNDMKNIKKQISKHVRISSRTINWQDETSRKKFCEELEQAIREKSIRFTKAVRRVRFASMVNDEELNASREWIKFCKWIDTVREETLKRILEELKNNESKSHSI